MELQSRLGIILKRLRETRKISQEKLANLSKVDRRYLSDVENGRRNVSLNTLERLAGVFNLNVSELVAMAEDAYFVPTTLQQLKESLCDLGFEDAIVLENPEYLAAVSGVTDDGRVVYDYDLMVRCLCENDGMTPDESIEFIEYNTVRAIEYMGPKAPVIVRHLNFEP